MEIRSKPRPKLATGRWQHNSLHHLPLWRRHRNFHFAVGLLVDLRPKGNHCVPLRPTMVASMNTTLLLEGVVVVHPHRLFAWLLSLGLLCVIPLCALCVFAMVLPTRCLALWQMLCHHCPWFSSGRCLAASLCGSLTAPCGYFAAIIVPSPLSGRYFVVKSVWASHLCRHCCPWSPLWQILCYRVCVGLSPCICFAIEVPLMFSGRCFAVIVVGCMASLSGCFAIMTWFAL